MTGVVARAMLNIKSFGRKFFKNLPFKRVHIGTYIRHLYFWRIVADLPTDNFTTVLDAGCGSGQLAVAFAQKFPNIMIYGIDIQKPIINQELPTNCVLFQGDLLRWNQPKEYDFIWCVDVLEHIHDSHTVVTKLCRSLREGGYFYLHTPYDVHGRRIFPEQWFSRFNNWSKHEHIGKQPTLDEYVAIFENLGLSVLSSMWSFGYWGELSWEIDQLTARIPVLRNALMPVLKIMAHLALKYPGSERRGNVLVLARKQ